MTVGELVNMLGAMMADGKITTESEVLFDDSEWGYEATEVKADTFWLASVPGIDGKKLVMDDWKEFHDQLAKEAPTPVDLLWEGPQTAVVVSGTKSEKWY